MTCEQVVFSKVLKIPQAPVKILVLKFLYHSLQLPIIKSHHFFFQLLPMAVASGHELGRQFWNLSEIQPWQLKRAANSSCS